MPSNRESCMEFRTFLSFVTTHPPSPDVIFFIPSKLKHTISYYIISLFLYFEKNKVALSSIILILNFLANL